MLHVMRAFFSVIGLICALVVSTCLGLGRHECWTAKPDEYGLFGNRMEDVSIATELVMGGWRFFVLGDIQNGFEYLPRIAEVVGRDMCSLIVQTGDFSQHADEGHFRLAAYALHESGLCRPVFVAPGNHDVDDGGALFESFIGKRRMRFVANGSLFVIVDNALTPPDPQQLAWLARTLSGARGMAHTFLFLHRPPISWEGGPPRAVEVENEELLSLVSRHAVDAVFAGHWHGYHREERDGVVFVVNGQGGDFDYEPGRYLTEVNLTEVLVRDDAFETRRITLDGRIRPVIVGRVKDTLLAHLVPLTAGRPLAGGIALGVSIALFAAPILLRRRPRK